MPQIRNKKSGSMDNVTDEQWEAMHKVEPGQIFTLASLFEVISPGATTNVSIGSVPMPEEVQKALEADPGSSPVLSSSTSKKKNKE